MELLRLLIRDPRLLIEPGYVFVLTLAGGWLVRRLILRGLKAWNDRTQSRVGLILDESLRTPIWFWIVILALHFAVQSSDLPAKYTERGASLLFDLWVVSLTLMSMRIAREMVRFYGAQVPGALPVTTLTQNLVQIGVLILGVMVMLGNNIARLTPVLTALGVGGIAVALALQDTLSNLFSGFYIAAARQVRLGDYIKLNTGEEGYVADISWRSTSIRALSNNLIIVPNSKLAQAVITNFHMPEKRMSVSLQVNVGYGSDADVVERLLLEIARDGAKDIPGLLPDPPASVTFDPGFCDSSLGFTLGFQIAEFSAQYNIRHELRKRILRRFRQEGIKIPFPTRTVHLEREPQA